MSFAPSYFLGQSGPALRALALAVGLLATSRADTIKMPNGEALQGTLLQETADYVLFRSASFGEMKIPRTPGLAITRTPPVITGTTQVSASAATAAPRPGPGGPAEPPPPGLLQRALGLSDRWSADAEANLLTQTDKFRATSRATELTVGYKVPNPTKPTQARHEYGLFGAYNFQKVNDTVVGENTELALRYFFQPLSPWLLVSQADWQRDRINGIDARSHVIAVPAYRWLDTPSTRLLAGLGPSFHSETLLTPSGPSARWQESGFRFAFYQLFLHKFTPGLTFRQTLLVLGRPKDPGTTYNLRFEASLRRMLTPHLSLSFAYDNVRNGHDGGPANASAFPEESIATLKLMLGYHL